MLVWFRVYSGIKDFWEIWVNDYFAPAAGTTTGDVAVVLMKNRVVRDL